MALAPYGDTFGLDAYISARGYSVSGLDVGDKGPALLRGSMSLDARYTKRWLGSKADFTQPRDFPRLLAFWPDGTAVTGTPDQVIYAAYELAYQEWRKPGSTAFTAAGGTGRKRRARVEGAVLVDYFDDLGYSGLSVYDGQIPLSSIIEGLLAGLVSTTDILPGALVV